MSRDELLALLVHEAKGTDECECQVEYVHDLAREALGLLDRVVEAEGRLEAIRVILDEYPTLVQGLVPDAAVDRLCCTGATGSSALAYALKDFCLDLVSKLAQVSLTLIRRSS